MRRYVPRSGDPEFAFRVRGRAAQRVDEGLLLVHLGATDQHLRRARSRLYRSQFLQENMRLKALAEISTMHSFA